MKIIILTKKTETANKLINDKLISKYAILMTDNVHNPAKFKVYLTQFYDELKQTKK